VLVTRGRCAAEKVDRQKVEARPRRAAASWLSLAVLLAGISLALWVSGCQLSEPYRTVAGGDAARGERALERYGCGSCHVIPGVRNAVGMVGPPLIWFGRRTMIAGEVANTPDELIAWLVDPQHIEPATAMPNLGVSQSDARDMAAYLYRLH
jgi:cytochrome c